MSDKPTSFVDRVEEKLGAELFRDAPPKGFRGVKHTATIINVARKQEAEFNAYIREMAFENSQLSERVAELSATNADLSRRLMQAEIRLRAHGLDLSEKQTERLLEGAA